MVKSKAWFKRQDLSLGKLKIDEREAGQQEAVRYFYDLELRKAVEMTLRMGYNESYNYRRCKFGENTCLSVKKIMVLLILERGQDEIYRRFKRWGNDI
ncbi:hypothetical protein [Anaerocolumna xylanovorans]|uniref:Uncharacterized protein n=1 Tax=Anaerocolumna xylanovorans DSM 12503 TaxID=1121345 RepID=A0A1M7Y6N2_9FIRM|nr:hypothetical protein [Anaerocolumna xylanovorans]SHO48292.1 hypothetical protein SAMN02745217_01758 [Anaerocolumna xylanovorans DSM 12503]